MSEVSHLSADYLRSIFRYDMRSGLLFWRKRTDATSSWNTRYAGKKAGCVNSDGYVVVRINNSNHQAHRVIWIMETGSAPEFLDHINGDRTDNRLGNLRPATKSENNRNSRIRFDNRSGAKGVSWAVREKKWRARIKVNGVERKLGYFSSIQEASEAYRNAAKLLHKEFARVS